MKITKITLRKHKLLSLRNIQELVFEPSSKFQLILGTNGSGKSTLLREYCPLAAIPSHYYKGGMKILEGVVQDKRYVLTSDFTGPKNLFSFVEIAPDGTTTELNPGYTGSVFNNLVWSMFGIDKEIQDIRIGKRKFTELSPSDRKSWISRISHADYTYALTYYQKLLSHYRDTLGSIKTDHNRLLEATAKVVAPEEESALRGLLVTLKSEVEQLNNLRPNPSMPYDRVTVEMDRFKKMSTDRLDAFRKHLRSSKELLPIGNPEQIQVDLRCLEIEHAKNNDRVHALFDRSGEITTILKDQGKTIGLDEEELHDKINLLQSKVDDADASMAFPLRLTMDRSEVQEAIFAHGGWCSQLEEVVSHMVADPEEAFTQLRQQQLHDAIQELTGQKNFLEVHIGKTEDAIARQVECSKEQHTECPNCKHQWHPGFSELVLRELKDKLVSLKEKHVVVQQKLQELQENMEVQRKHYAGLLMFVDLEGKYPLFRSFYAVARRTKEHLKNPVVLVQLAYDYGRELHAYKELVVTMNELDELHKAVSNKRFERIDVTKKLEEELENNVAEVARIYDSNDQLVKKIRFCQRKLSLNKTIHDVTEQAHKTKEDLEKLASVYVEHESRSFIGDMVLARNHKLITLEKSLKEVDLQNHHVRTLEKQIEEAKDYAKTLKVAVDTLSPREGLIAYGLTGFINHFLKIVNSLISKFCLYPMEIQSFVPDEEGIDLDYKFRIRIGGEIVDDISNCSEGQKELVNLAIVIASLVMLGLDTGDLFLDEFGVKLDPAHRASSHKAIEELLAHSNFSRVLMVSHFDESFNMNLESDVSVICDANLHLPSDLAYNRHMHIT